MSQKEEYIIKTVNLTEEETESVSEVTLENEAGTYGGSDTKNSRLLKGEELLSNVIQALSI